jgi:hypothetical protein
METYCTYHKSVGNNLQQLLKKISTCGKIKWCKGKV